MTKFHIKKQGNSISIIDEDGNILYTSARHSVAKKEKHPYLSGFSKIVDFGDSYSDLLNMVRSDTVSNRIRSYWENTGNYVLDVLTR